MKPLSANKALDTYFLEARSKLLDVAAILDRINRGQDNVAHDPRLARIQQALRVLQDVAPNRAERIQQIFSLEYDANWEKPKPR